MGELGDERSTAPADQHAGVGQELHISLRGGETLLWRGVLAHQLGTHLLFVELYHDPAGSIVHFGVGAVIEDGNSTVSLASRVVLEGDPGVLTHLEVAPLPAKSPYELSALALYLVDAPGIAGTEEQVAVGLYVYGIDVDVVEKVGIFGQLDVGLLDADVLQAVPLEDDFTALDVHLLDDPFAGHAILRAADRGEVRSRRGVGHQERGVLGRDEELVKVPTTVTVARAHPGYLTVGVVEDHVLADAVPGRDLALPPSEHGSAFVVLPLEVSRGPVPAKPHELTLVVDYHWTVLSGPFLQSSEDVAGGGVVVRLRSSHLECGRTQVGARAEGPHALFRRG